ncbi:unnamed protein product [Discosporangium mesarthrocarpum]
MASGSIPGMGSDTDMEVADCYTLLNVDRMASPKEIRAAYLHLASCLHPDKACHAHMRRLAQEEEKGAEGGGNPSADNLLQGAAMDLTQVRQQADKQFCIVDRAYRVLSDPVKKQAYDEYGMEGVKALEENARGDIGAHLKHPSQVRELLEDILQETAQRRLEAVLNSSGTITVDCEALPLWGNDGAFIPRHLVPEVNQLVIQQNSDVPLSKSTRASFGGFVLQRYTQ